MKDKSPPLKSSFIVEILMQSQNLLKTQITIVFIIGSFQSLEEEETMTPEQLAIKNVGKQDPKRHLEEHVDVIMTENIVQCLGAMLHSVVFK